jgi:membrane protease YdiL (CAAX protease family)
MFGAGLWRLYQLAGGRATDSLEIVLDQFTEAPLEIPRLEPTWRLAVRLIVDAIGIVGLAAGMLLTLAALVAAADAALRGVDTFLSDVASIRAFPGDIDRETIILGSFAIGSLLYVAIIAAILTVSRLRRGVDWRDYIAWRPFQFERIYVGLAIAGVVWGVGVGSIIEAFHPASKEWFIFPRGVAGAIVSFILVVILGPLCEEFLFRGWFYTALRPKLGFPATLAVTAIAFALAHWESTHLYALAVFPVGLLLGYARERGGSTKATFAFHGFYNFAGWILAAFAGK